MIKLDRGEIKNICKLADKFPEVNVFEVRQESSGIGISTVIRIKHKEENADDFPTVTEIDITDYGKW